MDFEHLKALDASYEAAERRRARKRVLLWLLLASLVVGGFFQFFGSR